VVPTPANELATTHTVTFGIDAQDVAAQGVRHGTFAEISGKGVDRSSGGHEGRRPVGLTGDGYPHDGSDEAPACAFSTESAGGGQVLWPDAGQLVYPGGGLLVAGVVRQRRAGGAALPQYAPAAPAGLFLSRSPVTFLAGGRPGGRGPSDTG
jgi:hypothetical protein